MPNEAITAVLSTIEGFRGHVSLDLEIDAEGRFAAVLLEDEKL